MAVALVVVAVVVVGCTSSPDGPASTAGSSGDTSSPATTEGGGAPVNFSGGGFALSAPNGSLAAGAAVSLSADTSAPSFASALAVGAPAPVDISTQTEPTSTVTLSTTYSPEVAPTGTRPLLAWYSEAMGIWVPVDTAADPTTKQLVAQVPHLSTWTAIASGVGSFLGGAATTITTSAVQGAVAIDNGLAAGINTVTTDAGNGLGWLSYQINKWAFSDRTDPPACGALPGWVQDPVQTTDSASGDPNAFLYACGQTGTADALQLVVVNNRPYAVELELPEQPSAVTVTPDSGEPFSGSVDLLLADAWRAMSGGRRLYLPPLSSTAIDLPQPQENVGVDTWHLSGEYNPALVLGSMLLNQALGKLIDAGLSGLPGADTVLGQITSCVAQSIGQPGIEDILTASPGPKLTDVAGAVRDCLQTAAGAVADTITKAAADQLEKNGTLSQTEATIALRAHDMQGELGLIAAAQQVYELGGFTIEAALAQAGQLAPIGITYTPGPIGGTATTPTALDPNSPYRMRAVSVGQEMTRSPDDSAFFTSPSGNINCALSPNDQSFRAVCDVKEYTYQADPRPSSCSYPYPWAGQFVYVTSTGAAAGACVGDVLVPQVSTTLPYGQSLTLGKYTCSSAEDGVTCSDTSTGNGFKVSKESFAPFDSAGPTARPSSHSFDDYAGTWGRHTSNLEIGADQSGTLLAGGGCCNSITYQLQYALNADGTLSGTVSGPPQIVGTETPRDPGYVFQFHLEQAPTGTVLISTNPFSADLPDLVWCNEQNTTQDPRCGA